MSSILLTAPAAEPLSLADAKGFLRVETDEDDALIAFAFIIYVWKVVVWDKVLGLGTTDALSGDVAQWALIVLTAYFGGRSLEKAARILARK